MNPNIALFLDRDGVINKKLPNAYVRNWSEMTLLGGVQEALSAFKTHFYPIVVVTNQQGIGKGLMSEYDLLLLHEKMQQELNFFFDAIYFAPALAAADSPLRKPNIGMALQAKKDFPDLSLERSLMVGDSLTDMQFGKNAGMKTIYIAPDATPKPSEADLLLESLAQMHKQLNGILKFF